MLKNHRKEFLVTMLLVSFILGACGTEMLTLTLTPVGTGTPSPPVATVAPQPIPTPLPILKTQIILTATPTPRPTGEEVTAEMVVNLCRYYSNVTLGWLEREDSNYHILTPDDLHLVLAVMAIESSCNPDLVSDDGYNTVGLMQVTHHNWVGECIEEIPCNIYWGMWILDRAIEQHGLEMGLAAYNCSLESIETDNCGPQGGLNYADKVLNYWLPYFE